MTDVLTRLRTVRHRNGWIFATMLVSSVLSLFASFVLAIDAVRLAADPSATLSCNINAVISCGTVAGSWQAQLFGFPNAFLGIAAEPVVITIAVASLGGVRFPRWFMLAAQVVYTAGLVFAYWLFYEAMFDIGALCPWCLLVTVSTTFVFTSLTHVNIRDGNLYLPSRMQRALTSAIEADLDLIAVTIWLLVLTLAVVLRYGAALFG
ncbi:vitamin K epoxide reductase family protein [Virgisporangium ochraceum]|uniref:Membrane protein n=1 Tax=Virgisporangium ochraceum TaxID=65505 RepID=A0A8J4EE95_9ACTN|nr:vitamin K epoxide reductase family protein [Virgisporangium ochraceum]GIJ71514.1 membrane protein [Virgisporangium ochraceum]